MKRRGFLKGIFGRIPIGVLSGKIKAERLTEDPKEKAVRTFPTSASILWPTATCYSVGDPGNLMEVWEEIDNGRR